MNPYWIIAFLAGAGIVASFFAFGWACMTRQFTGYDFGGIPLNAVDEDAEHTESRRENVGITKIRKLILAAGMAIVFGLISWLIYLTCEVASRGTAGG